MASCVVETRPCRTLVYFKLAVFTEVSTSAVAVKISARVNTDAMLAAVGCSAVVNTVFTVIAVETQLTRTGYQWVSVQRLKIDRLLFVMRSRSIGMPFERLVLSVQKNIQPFEQLPQSIRKTFSPFRTVEVFNSEFKTI